MRILLVALWALLAVDVAAAQQTRRPPNVRWTQLGPAPIANAEYSGRIAAVACSPSDSGRYFVGGADGGVWRTTDGGVTWEALTDGLPTTSIGALALDPSDENTIYAGTGEGNFANHSRYGLGLYKSTDGGDTWAQLAESDFSGRTFSRIVVDPANGQTVYAAVTRAGGFPELAAAKLHPGRNGDVGVFRSTDGGVSWSRLGGGLPGVEASDFAIDPSSSQVLYASIGRIFGHANNGVYKSIDGGGTWALLGGGLPSGLGAGRISLAVAPGLASRVYVLVTNPSTSTGGGASTQGAYRSDNGGVSWTSLPLGNIQVSYGWYLSVVTVDPSDPENVFFGGLTFHRSASSGGSFSNVTPPHVDLHAACWDAAGRLVLGDDGGVHRTTDLGDSWSSLNDGLGTIQFYAGLSSHPSDDEVFYGGTQDNGTNRRDANDVGWTQVFGGDGGWTQVHPTIADNVFVEYQGTANLFFSDDGGASWSYSGNGIDTSDRNCFLPPYLIDPADPDRMLYATHRIYESTNAGQSWSPLSGDLTTGTGAVRSLAIAPSDSSVIYAATNDGNLAVSTDGGANFQTVLTNLPGWPRVTREICVHPTDPQTAYLAVAAFGVEQLRRTTDGGMTWNALDQNLPDVPVNTVAVRPANSTDPQLIFAGTDSGLLVSANDGTTWERYGRGLPHAPIIDILLEPARNRIVVGTQGRGAWRAPLEVDVTLHPVSREIR